jgi:hypothetical protein
MSDKLLAAIRASPGAHPLHHQHARARRPHGGNQNIRKAGATIAGGNVSGDIKDAAEGARSGRTTTCCCA